MSEHALPETLLGLIQHYSPSGSEENAVSYLIERMKALGFDTAESDGAGNAVGTMGNGPRQIILLGHIDTVPGEIKIEQKGDLLYGRGSVDAKGPLACFTDAVATVGPIEGWQFIVIGAVGEEVDSPGAQHVAPRYQPEMTIIGEPSRWDRVTLGYKGSVWTEITVRQPMAHTAGQGGSACEAAVEVWNVVQAQAAAFNAERPKAFDQILPTLRGMNSGEDGFEEWAKLRVGARLPLDLSPEEWVASLHDSFPQAKVREIGFPVPAYRSDKRSPLVRAFLTGIRSVGGKPGFVLKTGTADFNIVGPAWNCPIVAYGPGDSSLDHTPNEHVSISEYHNAVAVLKAALLRLTAPR